MNAIQQLLTEHLDIWTAADTEKKSGRGRSSGNAASVYGIRKLRELILELAVRGKLVPQDANDEPASELLKRIHVEKARLIADGKIKKNKPLPSITEDEKPFDLPQGWEWTRVAHVGHDWGQKTPDSDFTYIEVSAIDSQRGIVSSPELVKPENAPSRARKVVKKGSVIYSTIRPYLLNIAVIEKDFLPEPIASTAFAVVHPFCLMPPRYLLCFFRSPVFVRYVESVQMGIAYPAINDGQFFSGLIPLPPIEEQHRIVAKVDELMALCDQLESRHNNAAEAHEKLVGHLLTTLTQSQNTADFSANWQRIAAHFDTLFTTEASIDALKQTLLQLAVMGKLVPQDPDDEPASALLKRIQAEKAKLIADGKIKKDKPLKPLTDEEKPYTLPCGWHLASFSKLGKFSGGKTPNTSRSEYWDGDIPWVTPKDMKSNLIVETEDHVSYKAVEDGLTIIPPRSILVVVRSGILRRTVPVAINVECCTVNQDLKVLQLIQSEMAEYIRLMVQGFEQFIMEKLTKIGTTVESIKFDEFSTYQFPLPPLAEQHRIVAKVDELMALCDQLKTRVTEANQLQQKLADVFVEQAVA